MNLRQLVGSRQAPFWGERPHSGISVGCRNGGTHLGAHLQCGLPGLLLGMKRRLARTRRGADGQMAKKLPQDPEVESVQAAAQVSECN